MNVFEIKRGDILVIEHSFERGKLKMSLIAKDKAEIDNIFGYYKTYKIKVLAGIGLTDNFITNGVFGFKESDKLRKPTFIEFFNIMNRLKINGLKYNRKIRKA